MRNHSEKAAKRPEKDQGLRMHSKPEGKGRAESEDALIKAVLCALEKTMARQFDQSN